MWLLAASNFAYHGFFFVLFIQRMLPLLARRRLHASDPFVAEASFYLRALAKRSSVTAESLAALFTQLGGQLFGFDASASGGAAAKLAVAKFMVWYELGEGAVHFWVMASSVGGLLCAPAWELWCTRSFFAAKLACYSVWGLPYVGCHWMLWTAAVAHGPALALQQQKADGGSAEAAARLSFHVGAVAFGVLATTAGCFVFSGAVLLLAAPAAQLSPLAAALVGALLCTSAACGLPCTLRRLLPWLLRLLQPGSPPAAPAAAPPAPYPVAAEPHRAPPAPPPALAEPASAPAPALAPAPAPRGSSLRFLCLIGATQHVLLPLSIARAALRDRCCPFSLALLLCRLCRVRLHLAPGSAPLASSPRTVFLANHRGWADFCIDCALTSGGTFLAKFVTAAVLPYSALYAKLTGMCLYFGARRGTDRAALARWLAAHWATRPHAAWLVYPEGHRNRRAAPLPLKHGVLDAALALNATVQCVVTTNKEFVVDERRLRAAAGVDCVVATSAPLAPAAFGGDRAAFLAAVHAAWDEAWARAHGAHPDACTPLRLDARPPGEPLLPGGPPPVAGPCPNRRLLWALRALLALLALGGPLAWLLAGGAMLCALVISVGLAAVVQGFGLTGVPTERRATAAAAKQKAA